jgi:hypothetical protein
MSKTNKYNKTKQIKKIIPYSLHHTHPCPFLPFIHSKRNDERRAERRRRKTKKKKKKKKKEEERRNIMRFYELFAICYLHIIMPGFFSVKIRVKVYAPLITSFFELCFRSPAAQAGYLATVLILILY